MPEIKHILDLVADANKVIQTISIDDAIAAHGNDAFVFVDIRDVRELEREGTIPNAQHAPRGMLEFWFDPESPYHREVFGDEGKTYVLYCQSAWRSALATKTLVEMGFENVRHFDKGFKGWKEADGPIVEFSRKK
jgi:rhodanese-related sulfurtransferase